VIFTSDSNSSAQSSDRPFASTVAESASSDTALLAWLSQSLGSSGEHDGNWQTTGDESTTDDSDAVDAAFETLDESALIVALAL
jgi:hypothetical protein